LGGTTRLSFGPFVTAEDVIFSAGALTEIAAARAQEEIVHGDRQ